MRKKQLYLSIAIASFMILSLSAYRWLNARHDGRQFHYMARTRMRNISTALEVYNIAKGIYPQSPLAAYAELNKQTKLTWAEWTDMNTDPCSLKPFAYLTDGKSYYILSSTAYDGRYSLPLSSLIHDSTETILLKISEAQYDPSNGAYSQGDLILGNISIR